MMESHEQMSLDGAYEVDGGRSGENIEDVGPVAMESTTVLKPAK